jgi:uncharacterized membrane protein
MKNQSLAVSFNAETGTQLHDFTSTRPRYFRQCCSLLGFFVGVMSQRNDFSSFLMSYFDKNVTNIYLLSMLYATSASLTLMVFLVLLRSTHGFPNDGNVDLECYVGNGSIIGVTVAWVVVAPSVVGTCLLILNMAFSVLLFHVLLRVFGIDTPKKNKKEDSGKDSEYQIMIT